ncbi:MAG: helix-turn-helix domain-containing protein [Sphingobacteriales bacterium]|nr:helix-turn-helix domain-containing protein [Sphingobacteriales bacterium]
MGKLDRVDPEKPVTAGDLLLLREELFREMNKVMGVREAIPKRPWLKSHEVRRLLKISSGTLQHMRDSGKLKFTRVGGIFFYDVKDIEGMMG